MLLNGFFFLEMEEIKIEFNCVRMYSVRLCEEVCLMRIGLENE